jgi:hypothetical protein
MTGRTTFRQALAGTGIRAAAMKIIGRPCRRQAVDGVEDFMRDMGCYRPEPAARHGERNGAPQ